MEIPKIELVSKNSNENYISTENIIGSFFGIQASELSFESRLSLDLKSKEPAGDGEKDGTRESVSTLRLSIGCHELNISAQESEVYFQKITASVVFSEDYKCRIRKKKCESDCHITNIFGEKDEKYAKLIAEAKKRQRCGPCLTKNECNCGDANVLPVIETRISARPKVVETFLAKPSTPKPNKINTKVRRKTGKPKKKLGKVDQSKNDEENDDESLNSVLEEYKKALDEGRLRRDSMIVTRERISALLERPVVENSSQNDLDDDISFDPNSRKVSMSPAPPQKIHSKSCEKQKIYDQDTELGKMGNERHQMITCKEHKRPNGSAIIPSHLKIPFYPKIEQVPQNETCILRSSNSQDFRVSRSVLKQQLIRHCPNFLLTENSVLEFRETYPLEHSIFSCATGFLYTDNYFNDKRIFECNLTKNVKNFLWISNQALNTNYPKVQYKSDSVDVTSKKKPEKRLAFPKINKRKLEKLQDIRLDKTNENEERRNKDISNNLIYSRNGNEKTPSIYTNRHGKIKEETNNPSTKSGTDLLQNSFLHNKCCLSEEKDSKQLKVNKNSTCIADEYENLSKISSTSMIDTCSDDSKIHSDGKQNVQVFCLNCNNEPDFPMPPYLECCSDNYISAEEPSTCSSCECVTCPKFEENIIELINQGIQTMRTDIRKELRNMPITTNDKGHFIDRAKCNIENLSTRTQCPGAVKSPCAECTTPPSLDTTGQCHNSMKKRTIQDDDMESFSALSLFFILKDLNTGSGSYCKRQESYRLLSTAMICMRVKNTQSKKKISKPKIASRNERTGPCSDISGPYCRTNEASTQTHQNSNVSDLICPSKRVGSDRKMNTVFTETPQNDGYKVLGVQTSEHKEKRYPRELNLLLSFHPDKRKIMGVKDCPGEKARSLPYRSYLQRHLPKTDKTAQACITQQSACVQLSMTNTPIMHEKGNQFCPSRTSKSIQPSSTIFLRQNRAATFPRASSGRSSRICRPNFSTESSLFDSPPPCALYLPDFGEASGQCFEAPPVTPLMIPMAVDFQEGNSSTSLACHEMKKKYSSTLEQVGSCTANLKPNCKLACGGEMLKNLAKVKEIIPSRNNCFSLGSTRTPEPPCRTCSSHNNKDIHTPPDTIGVTDSEEGLEILKLKQTSLLSKEQSLFPSFKFKSANDIQCCDRKKKDMSLFSEDFQSLKKAIEKFMTIDRTGKRR